MEENCAGLVMVSLWDSIQSNEITATSGITGYLDEEINISNDAPAVIKGVDDHGRKFIRLHLDVELADLTRVDRFSFIAGIKPGESRATGIMTLFQRYSDNPIFWAAANNSEPMLTSLLCPSAITLAQAFVFECICNYDGVHPVSVMKHDHVKGNDLSLRVRLIGKLPTIKHTQRNFDDKAYAN